MFASVLNKGEPHQRTIIHLDMDYYYAQVEEIRDPKLKDLPMGVSQKHSMVTCNYVARAMGVKKMMSLNDAKRVCPSLILVNGEDLTPYRQMTQKIFEILQTFTSNIEKLGFDENFLDVSSIVEQREQERMNRSSEQTEKYAEEKTPLKVVGSVHPRNFNINDCDCGCAERLAIGSQIASEIREAIFSKLGMTCSAGISYNKLLAKLVGSLNKPNKQTVLVSTYTERFMRELGDLHRITGIGQKTETLLIESGITNVEELQRCSLDFLKKKLGFETATKLRDLAFGKDLSAVRPTGKPKSIGLEDSSRPMSMKGDVEERFRMLLMRLMEQVSEDGRIPICVKVMIRKFDAQKKSSHRETKQANILASLFQTNGGTESTGPKVMLADGAQDKLLKIIMRLFERIVDLSKPFNITLIGLSFSKFQQRKIGSSSIANFLIKKTDLEVQSITSLISGSGQERSSASPTPSVSSTNSDDAFRSSPTTFQPSDQFYRRRATAASPIPMLTDNGSESGATNSDFSDFSETEVEPSPKKSRFGKLFPLKRRCVGTSHLYQMDSADIASPSKLRVSDLRLNSRESDKEFPIYASNPATLKATNLQTSICMSNVVAQRFRTIQTPKTLLNRIEQDESSASKLHPAFKALRQFSMNSATSNSSDSPLHSPMDESTSTNCSSRASTPGLLDNQSMDESSNSTTLNENETSNAKPKANILENIPCPAGVDPEVFNALPVDVQNELIASWRSSLAAAAAAVANGEKPTTSLSNPRTNPPTIASKATPPANSTQKNTLYRYFLRNK